MDAMTAEAAVDAAAMKVMLFDEGRRHECDGRLAAKTAMVPMRASMKPRRSCRHESHDDRHGKKLRRLPMTVLNRGEADSPAVNVCCARGLAVVKELFSSLRGQVRKSPCPAYFNRL